MIKINTTTTNTTTNSSKNATSTPSKSVVYDTPVYDVISNDAFDIMVVLLGSAFGALFGAAFYLLWWSIKQAILYTNL